MWGCRMCEMCGRCMWVWVCVYDCVCDCFSCVWQEREREERNEVLQGGLGLTTSQQTHRFLKTVETAPTTFLHLFVCRRFGRRDGDRGMEGVWLLTEPPVSFSPTHASSISVWCHMVSHVPSSHPSLLHSQASFHLSVTLFVLSWLLLSLTCQ